MEAVVGLFGILGLAWYFFASIYVGAVASDLNRGGVLYFFISIFVSPLLAILALIAVGRKQP